MTFAIDPPVTMKADKLEAVLRSRLATMVNIGMKSPPPPIIYKIEPVINLIKEWGHWVNGPISVSIIDLHNPVSI